MTISSIATSSGGGTSGESGGSSGAAADRAEQIDSVQKQLVTAYQNNDGSDAKAEAVHQLEAQLTALEIEQQQKMRQEALATKAAADRNDALKVTANRFGVDNPTGIKLDAKA